LANGISGFAQGVSMLAIPWYFASRGASHYFNTGYGLLTIVILLFGLYAGMLVDRYSRKMNFLITSLVCGIIILAIASIGYINGSLPDLLVMAVFGITMLNYNIHYPTLYAFGQEITEPQFYQKLNSNIEIVGQSTSILSGGFAALLLEGVSAGKVSLFGVQCYMPFAIPRWEIYDVFMMDAVTYFIAAILIIFIKYKPVQRTVIDKRVFQRIRKGFDYLKHNTSILLFGVFSYFVFAMLLVEIHAVLPGYVERHLNENGSVFAMADGIYAIGALLAGVYVAKVFQSVHAVKSVIILTLLTVFIFLWAFVTRSVAVIFTVSFILGFTNAGIRVMRLTYLFSHVPNEVMGRVGSIFNMINVMLRTLFIFIFSMSVFSISDNIRWAYLIMAMVLMIAALILIVNYERIKHHSKMLHE
jgi:MFS family permease